MNCSTCRMLSGFFGLRDGELAREDADAVAAHLADCPACAKAVRQDRELDERISRVMKDVPVPADLKGRLLESAAMHRAGWYRQKAYYLVGMAASVLLVVGGVFAWQILTAPELSLSEIVAQADRQEQNRAGTSREFLARQGIAFHPERPLNLNLAESRGLGELRGRTVPVIYLVNSAQNARATVYIVRDSDFDWRKLPQDGTSVPSTFGHQVAVLRDTRRPDVGYVVVFTGAGLESFLEDRSAL